jgi:hypothetical protein
MALRYSFDLGDEADRLEAAVEAALDAGVRTRAADQPKAPWQNQPPRSVPPWAWNSHSRVPSSVSTRQ